MSTNDNQGDHRRPFEVIETPDSAPIDALVSRTRRLLRSTWTTTGLAMTCGIFVSALLLVTVVDLAMPLSTFLRVAGWLAVVSAGTVAFILGVVAPLLHRLTAVKVARQIESHLPGSTIGW